MLPRLPSESLNSRIITGVSLAILLGITWIVYSPGLSGSFLFDDFSNLAQLGSYGNIDNPESLWLYLVSNFSGPTGRPISMLSFLLDARDWPADPEPFKRTNLIIHLLIGVILFLLVHKLTTALDHGSKATSIAILSTAIWLLHPLWVSTTLYAVQRMTQLSTLFVLLGLLIYTTTRIKNHPAVSRNLLIGTFTAIWVIGLLAILSKENGALLPLLAVVIEITVLSAHDSNHNRKASKGFFYWRILLLGIPTLLLLAYLATHLGQLFKVYDGIREFTPSERLLTQGRILWDYLFNFLIPHPHTGGLFNDDIIVSTNLIQPWNTILAWAALLAIAVWALKNRLKQPAVALAILFFLAGHLLESSVIPLEMYFEHRNYLPASLLSFPIALWLLTRNTKGLIRHLPTLGILAALTILTLMRSTLWGHPFLQALSWAQIKPESPRAQIYLATKWLETNNINEAIRLNKNASLLAPKEITAIAQGIIMECRQNNLTNRSVSRLRDAVSSKKRVGIIDIHQLASTLDLLMSQTCGNTYNHTNTQTHIEALINSKHGQNNKALKAMLLQRLAVLSLKQNKHKQALEQFYHSTNLNPLPGMILKNTAIMASHNAYEEALEYLDSTDLTKQHESGPGIFTLRKLHSTKSEYYQRQKQHLRDQIYKDTISKTSQKKKPTND